MGAGRPRQDADGWRIVLPAASFDPEAPKLSINRLGSYELRRHHFAQLWCDDIETRRRALYERALSLTRAVGVNTEENLLGRIAPVARRLEVPVPNPAELREFALRSGKSREAARLEALSEAPQSGDERVAT
jgi:hypothetical protein